MRPRAVAACPGDAHRFLRKPGLAMEERLRHGAAELASIRSAAFPRATGGRAAAADAVPPAGLWAASGTAGQGGYKFRVFPENPTLLTIGRRQPRMKIHHIA